MQSLVISPPLLGFVVATRAALAFGIGLLVANRIPEPRRRAIAMTLIGLGAATTLPAARLIFRNRSNGHEHRFSGEGNPGHDVRTVADM
jgi:hypothetical protein